MKLWLRVRHARTCVITILIVAIALILVRNLYLPLPNVVGGPGLAIPLGLLLPVAVSIVIAWGMTTGDPLLEMVASRPLRLLDASYTLAAAMLTLAACALVGLVTDNDRAFAAGRNALGYVGLTVIGQRLVGPQAAAVLPAGFVIATSLFGSYPDRQPRWWAWPLAAANDILAWRLAVVLLLVGAVVLLRHNQNMLAE